jgi:hypothetical protein
MKALTSLGKAAGPTLQRSAPGIAQGAATGASVAGPWGPLIGAGAGLAAASLTSKGKPSSAVAPTPPVTVPPLQAGAPEVPAVPVLPTGQSAAATLVGLLENDSTRNLIKKAFVSQALDASGSQHVVTAAGKSVPRAAINSLLTLLLANATEQLVEAESITDQSYLLGESGEFLVDPASPEQQAALVLSHLQSASASKPQSNLGEFIETAEWMLQDSTDSESEGWLESEDYIEMVRLIDGLPGHAN